MAQNSPHKVGKFYMVPCVFSTKWNQFVPIFGVLHEDAEVIGVKDDHWHIDFRFMSRAFIRSRINGAYPTYRTTRRISVGAAVHRMPISRKNTSGEVELRRMKCKRPHPTFPKVTWTPDLEKKYAAANARCGTCPHRGASLNGAPVRNGARVCPLHGLAWNVKTGNLQPRTK